MPTFHGMAVDEKKITKAVTALEKRFAPDVVRVRYTLRDDWTGDPSVYFRVLLTDKAAHPDRLGSIVRGSVECYGRRFGRHGSGT